MGGFLEKNWFNLCIVILLGIFVFGILCYLFFLNNKSEPMVQEQEIKISEPVSTSTPETKKIEKPVVNNTSIKSQIIYFESVLEDQVLEASINCKVFVTYNNVSKYGGTDIKTGFPDSYEDYKNKCAKSYLEINLLKNKLVAEPELQNLRKLLTEYIDLVRGIASYSLDGGSEGKVIDVFSDKADKLLINSREELLRVQRLYNVQPQYE